MNTKTLAKVNRFGKIGKAVMTVLLAFAIIITVILGAAAVYTATLPKDCFKITVTSNAEFKVDESIFSSVWSMLSEGFSGASDKDPSDMLKDGKKVDSGEILPPEDTELKTELNFFDQSYSSATVRSAKDKKIIDAKSSPAEYRFADLVTLLAFTALFTASVAVSLLMLQRLFKVLSECSSPFCTEFVSKLKIFGVSLLPVTFFASVGETLALRFLTAGRNSCISVQWGMLVTFAVTMCLVAVFRYGVQLQKESDETL